MCSSDLLELDNIRQQLKAQIDAWEKDYLIISPVEGRIVLYKYWSENQNITQSERVATVLPFDSTIVIGKSFIPFSSFSKVEVGQRVKVRLDNYSSQEYGHVEGRVQSISPIPEPEGYVVEIIFPNGLYSSYGIELKYVYQMTGTADVITKDIRLIHRFTQPIRALFD